MGIDHLMKQVALGEFALLSDEARTMTAGEFAMKHDSSVVRGATMDRVAVDGCDYYWSRKTGKFDGWGRGV